MKPEKQNSNRLSDQELLLYLEGSLAPQEIERVESEIQNNPERKKQMQELEALLKQTGYEASARLTNEQLDVIAANITKPAGVLRLRGNPLFKGAAGVSLLVAAASLALIFFKPDRRESLNQLDWEATRFETLRLEIELGSLRIAEGDWQQERGTGGGAIKRADIEIIELQLGVSQLETTIPFPEGNIKNN